VGSYPIKFYFKLFFLHIKQNGIIWTLCFSIRHFLHGALRALGNIMLGREERFNLPGANSVLENTLKWNHYRWELGENEWTQSAEWKQSIIDHVMLKNITPDRTVLEIGPGFGRWTRKLVEISKRLIVVDISEKCIEHCKKTFGENDNIEFHLNDGGSLDFVADDSVDFVWSFDVFVHVEPVDVDRYLSEFRRILKKDGQIIIHHGIIGKSDHNWRSTLTLQIFTELLQKHDFVLIDQFSSWGDSDDFKVESGDLISIFAPTEPA